MPGSLLESTFPTLPQMNYIKNCRVPQQSENKSWGNSEEWQELVVPGPKEGSAPMPSPPQGFGPGFWVGFEHSCECLYCRRGTEVKERSTWSGDVRDSIHSNSGAQSPCVSFSRLPGKTLAWVFLHGKGSNISLAVERALRLKENPLGELKSQPRAWM